MLIRTVAPAELPLTLEEVKDHLHVTGTTDDAMITAYLDSAVDQFDGARGILNRALVTQTWEMKRDGFPSRGYFDLPLPPLQSVTSITYLDSNGDSQTLATSKYRVLNANDEMNRGRIELEYGESWPSTYSVQQAVTVTFIAGYGARNDVPPNTRHLIAATVKGSYDKRMPMEAEALMATPAYVGMFNVARFPSFG